MFSSLSEAASKRVPRHLRMLVLTLAACNPEALIGYDPSPEAPTDAGLDAGLGDAALSDAGDAGAVGEVDARLPIKGPLSGLPWVSGAHHSNEPAKYLEFGDWRGRTLDLATLYVDRTSWVNVVTPTWFLDTFASFPGQLVLNEPLYPPDLGDNQACARGDYDGQWRMLGDLLVSRGRADSIVRLGWGPTDPEHAWRSDADPSAWIACYRRVVDALRERDPSVLIDWSFDPIASSIPQSGDPYDTYPGDDYVDIVGIDAFDRYPPTRDEAAWQAKFESPLGLGRAIAFARAHGKRLSVGEWGVVTCGDSSGGDNPFYVRKMVETFRANADILAYESYFDDREESCSQLLDASSAPMAAAEYVKQYSAP
ncbi:MAG: glycosyl hydrolase [Myxococcales bacterium]